MRDDTVAPPSRPQPVTPLPGPEQSDSTEVAVQPAPAQSVPATAVSMPTPSSNVPHVTPVAAPQQSSTVATGDDEVKMQQAPIAVKALPPIPVVPEPATEASDSDAAQQGSEKSAEPNHDTKRPITEQKPVENKKPKNRQSSATPLIAIVVALVIVASLVTVAIMAGVRGE